ncbi:hypothetical protein ACFFX0_25200 [Citricoccus parietis]|uniref:Uncharacterized protein n=1 Tax=Citricoccus parietis TaxID=592307 RepID=A0ABV5G5T5_9MICC
MAGSEGRSQVSPDVCGRPFSCWRSLPHCLPRCRWRVTSHFSSTGVLSRAGPGLGFEPCLHIAPAVTDIATDLDESRPLSYIPPVGQGIHRAAQILCSRAGLV